MSKIGPMHLCEVKGVHTKTQSDMTYYQIRLESDAGTRMKLAASALHAFTVIRDGEEKWLPTNQLIRGDQIWVDMVAFMGDGSIYKEKKKEPKVILKDGTQRTISELKKNDEIMSVGTDGTVKVVKIEKIL